MKQAVIRPLVQADLRRVRAVFADVDGTLTHDGRLTSTVLRAIEWLVAHRVKLVLVSGRPSGWGECWARELPVSGVIVENGGLYYLPDSGGRLKKVYPQPPGVIESQPLNPALRQHALEHTPKLVQHLRQALVLLK